jgi:hypothetical protein
MSGSAGFLAMEVKLDNDKAESALRDLAKYAKAQIGKPIALTIDASALREMAAAMKAVEKSFASTLAVVRELSAATAAASGAAANLAASTNKIDRQTRAVEEQVAQLGLLRTAWRTATVGVDWGVTAVGAAQARNYGYSVGAIINMGKAMATSLKGVPGPAAAVAGTLAAIALAAGIAAVAVGKLAVDIAKIGTKGATDMEMLIVQLNAMLPTAAMAKEEVEGLFELGTRTVAPTAVLIDLDKRLLLAGGAAAAMRRDLLEGFGAFSTAAGLSTEQMNSLSYLVSEVTLKGRLMRTEMSQQFSSAGLSSAGFLQATAKELDTTVASLNQKLTEGAFTSEMFVRGLTAYFSEFRGAAEGAMSAVNILKENAKDAFTAAISQAFYNAGVTSALSKLWLAISDIVLKIKPAFSVIGESVNRFISTVTQGFASFGGGGGAASAMVGLFGTIIPKVIDLASAAMSVLLKGLALIWPTLKLTVQTLFATVKAMLRAAGGTRGLGVAFIALAAFAVPPAMALRILAGALLSVIDLAVALSQALRGDLSGAWASVKKAGHDMAQGFSDAWAAANGFRGALKDIGKEAKKAKPPELKDSGRTPPLGADVGDKDKDKGKGASQKVSEMAKALAELWEQTRRWMGQRSELEKSLLGSAEGFTATVDQIIDSGVRLTQTLSRAGYAAQSPLVKAVKREVMALAKLALQRDKLQKTLEQQQEALKKLQGDKSSMATGVAQSLNAFLWALQTESETIQEYTRLDPVGSFAIVQRRSTKSWVEALRERLSTVKKFMEDIRALQKAGLNPETLRQLVEAGPEAAANAVAELTAGGKETIAEVNAIQTEMAQLGASFADEQAGNYYDVGIATAEALVAGTQAALDVITKQAESLAEKLYQQMKKIAKPAADAGTEAGTAFGDAFASSAQVAMPQGLESWNEMGGPDPLKAIVPPVVDVDGPIEGLKAKLSGFGSWVSANASSFWAGLTSAFPYIKEYVVEKFNSTVTWFKDLPGKVRGWAGDAWDGLKSGFPDMLGWLKDKFESALDWLRGKGKYSGGGLPGSVQSGVNTITDLVSFGKLKDGAIAAMKGGINSILKLWNAMKFTFPEVNWRGVKLGGWTVDTPNIPLLAKGGMVDRPTLAGIGEAGREAVLPLTNPRAMSAIADAILGGRSDAPPTWHIYVGDREITDIVRVEMQAADGRRAARAYAGRGI